MYYVSELGGTIGRDLQYLKLFKPDLNEVQVEHLQGAANVANRIIKPPLGCLFAWSKETGDAELVDRHLGAFVAGFRQLATLSWMPNAQEASTTGRAQQLTEVSAALSNMFVRNSLNMASDIVAATASKSVINLCGPWLSSYCPEGFKHSEKRKPDDKPNEFYKNLNHSVLLECLNRLRSSMHQKADNAAWKRVGTLSDELKLFANEGKMLERPYFAMGYAGIMAQLGYYAAAASILDDWLIQQRQRRLRNMPDEELVQSWYVLRIRITEAAYVEEWLAKEGSKAGTRVRDEHLANLNLIKEGLRERLKDLDFFKPYDKPCDETCAIVLKRPGACKSTLPDGDLKLWRNLYTSYVSIEATHIEPPRCSEWVV